MIGSKTAWYLVLEMNQGAKKLRIPVFEGFFFEGNINSCFGRAPELSKMPEASKYFGALLTLERFEGILAFRKGGP